LGWGSEIGEREKDGELKRVVAVEPETTKKYQREMTAKFTTLHCFEEI
jgi:hypothetical protein